MDQTTQSFFMNDVISHPPMPWTPHLLETPLTALTSPTEVRITTKYYYLPLQINPPILRSIHSSHRIAISICSVAKKEQHPKPTPSNSFQ